MRVQTCLLVGLVLLGSASADPGDRLYRVEHPAPDFGDEWGRSMDVSGDVLIIGVWGDDDDARNSGAAYLLEASTGMRVGRINPQRPGETYNWGRGVAIEDDIAALGGPGVDASAGAVALFDVTDPAAPTFLAEVVASDRQSPDGFGLHVEIEGDLLAVASLNDNTFARDVGSVYVYDISNPTMPVELHRITPADGREDGRFGWDMDLSGDVLIVSESRDRSSAGVVYLYNARTAERLDRIEHPEPALGDHFGSGVAIDGNTSLIGDETYNGFRGRAWLIDATTGAVLDTYDADDDDQPRAFGHSVDLAGDTIVIGARDDQFDPLVFGDEGAGYLFDRSTGQQVAKLLPFGRAFSIDLGAEVIATPDLVFVGDPLENIFSGALQAGAIYAFDGVGGVVCVPDLDGDGELTVFDFLEFQNLFGRGDLAADLDGDGELTVFDFLQFQNLFAMGCM